MLAWRHKTQVNGGEVQTIVVVVVDVFVFIPLWRVLFQKSRRNNFINNDFLAIDFDANFAVRVEISLDWFVVKQNTPEVTRLVVA